MFYGPTYITHSFSCRLMAMWIPAVDPNVPPPLGGLPFWQMRQDYKEGAECLAMEAPKGLFQAAESRRPNWPTNTCHCSNSYNINSTSDSQSRSNNSYTSQKHNNNHSQSRNNPNSHSSQHNHNKHIYRCIPTGYPSAIWGILGGEKMAVDDGSTTAKTSQRAGVGRDPKAKAGSMPSTGPPIRRWWQMKAARLAVAYQHGDWPMLQFLCDQYGQELRVERNPNIEPYQFIRSYQTQDYQHCQRLLTWWLGGQNFAKVCSNVAAMVLTYGEDPELPARYNQIWAKGCWKRPAACTALGAFNRSSSLSFLMLYLQFR